MDSLSSLAAPAMRIAVLAAVLILAARGLTALSPSLAADRSFLGITSPQAPAEKPAIDRERDARLETATFSMG